MINKKSGIFQSTISIFGNFFATGLSAIAVILISRLLGPEKFGLFSVGFSIVLMITRINEVGLNTAIVKFASSSDTKTNQNKIYSMTLRYKLLISGLIFLIGLLSADFIADKINFSETLIIKLAFTAGLITVYYEQLLFTLQSVHRFTNSVVINAMQAGTKLFGAAILFMTGANQVWPFFLAYIISPVVPVLFSKQLLPKWIKINLSAYDSKIKNKLFGLAKHSSVALISAGIIENIDILFLQKNLTSYETGLYSGVSRIAMIFALVAYSLGNVLNARVAKYKDFSHLSKYIKKAFIVAALSLLGFIVFIPFAKLLILLTIGGEYLSGIPILIILTAASFLAVAAIPFIALFYSFNMNWYFSLSGILQLAIVLVGNIIFVPMYGLQAAAWTRLAARVFLLAFTLFLSMYFYYKNYVKKNKSVLS
jgi:O-antigen/teichoic acid export membrane protein